MLGRPYNYTIITTVARRAAPVDVRDFPMKVLCVLGRHAYGDPTRGEGYEHANFLPALRRMGHQVELFDSWEKSAYRDFADLNVRLVETVVRLRPQLVLFVLMSYEIWLETLDLLRDSTDAALVHWATDDSWKYHRHSRYLARHFDLHVTTCPAALEWARRDGLPNVYLSQWGASSATLAEPLPSERCRYDVSFVGAKYGNRPRWVEGLRSRGITVECFGFGWPRGPVSSAELAAVVRESRISLNFADSGLVWTGAGFGRSRQIKARTFEVPGAGGCLLTEPADGLERYYVPDREIVLFTDLDTLHANIERLLEHPRVRDAIAKAGFERTAREHTYEARFAPIFDQALLIAARRGRPARDADGARDEIARIAHGYATGVGLHVLRWCLLLPFVLAFGRRRGPRAARRALYEAAWRARGAPAYSARGLAGRLFYRES